MNKNKKTGTEKVPVFYILSFFKQSNIYNLNTLTATITERRCITASQTLFDFTLVAQAMTAVLLNVAITIPITIGIAGLGATISTYCRECRTAGTIVVACNRTSARRRTTAGTAF